MTDTYLGFASLLILASSVALWFRAVGRVAIPENRSGYIASWVVAAALGVAALLGEPGWLGGVAAGIGTLASGLFILLVSISRQKTGDGAIQVGGSLPHFTATDEHGQVFDSESLVGHPVLIKFFRAHW